MTTSPPTIAITLAALYRVYAGSAPNGRVACPVRTSNGVATHIYRGFGAIRLENITGPVLPGKGFQGEEIAFSRDTRAYGVVIRLED